MEVISLWKKTEEYHIQAMGLGYKRKTTGKYSDENKVFLQKLLFFPEAEKILKQLQDSVLLSFGTLK